MDVGAGGPVVVVGAGHAAVEFVDALRAEGFGGPVTVLATEVHPPYQRPPLSKDFMGAAAGEEDALPLRAETFFAQRDIEFRPGVGVTRIDRPSRQVETTTGELLPYGRLVLATGARNRRLQVPGVDLPGIHYLRTLDDAQRLRAELPAAERVLVVGAGFIGLEFAAAARQRGAEVTVVEFGSRLMGRAVSPAMSESFLRRHRARGMDVRFGESISGFRPGAQHRVEGIGARGEVYPADLVVIGIGVLPNTEVAQEAGLEVENGIVVDALLRTSDPWVYAIGDCCNYPDPVTGGRVRLESVPNALHQAKVLARTFTGRPEEFVPSPWFWTHQGPDKLQIAGLVGDADEVVTRGDVDGDGYSLVFFRDGVLLGAESLNSARDHLAVRRMLENGVRLTPLQAGDPAFDLRRHSREVATA
jgi:3-phenylpropionate/trans-cinnamate dioxygenase ferredoxin reductase subunit